MNISDFIVELLKKGNAVELPGFGTLSPKEEQAHIDQQSGTFFPTRRTVAFDNKTVGNKEIVKQIAEHECVSDNVAEMMWKNYLDALKDKMERSGSHTFDGVGSIEKVGTAYGFTPIAGLNLDGDKHHTAPINNVNTYTATDDEDPFAVYEQPFGTKPAPKVEAKPEPKVEATPKEVIVEEAKPAVAEVPARPEPCVPVSPEPSVAEPIHTEEPTAVATPTPEPQPKAEVEAQPKPKKEVKEATTATHEEHPAETPKEATHKAPTAMAQEQPSNAEKMLKELQEMPDNTANDTHNKKQKKRRRRLWTIIIVLLLHLAGGAYYYFVFAPTHDKGLIAMVKDLFAKGETATPEPETIATITTNNEADNEKETEKEIATSYNLFSFNTDLIEFEEGDIDVASDQVCDYLRDYISTFLSNKHYTTAIAPMMSRVKDYAQTRIGELYSTDRFVIQRFLPNEDYIYNYCYPSLKVRKANKSRTSVQAELMDYAILEQILNEVVGELGLSPDQMAAPKPAEPQVVTPKYTAKFTTKSKQGFDIVAGFYTSKASADKMANKLKGLGCDAYVIDRNHLYYVSMGSAPTRTAAESMFKHIKSWYSGDIAIREIK